MDKTFTRKLAKSNKNRFSPLTIFLCTFLILYTIILFGLVLWGFLSTFKEYAPDFRHNMGFGLPKTWFTKYYEYFLNDYNIPTNNGTHLTFLPEMFVNSIGYALGCAIFQTIVPCLTAYVCARFNFKFLKIYHVIVIVTMIIPIVGSMASELRLATTLQLNNHIYGLWIMKANFLGLYFLIFYTTFKNLPAAYSEAAKIDGASNFTILTKVIMPLIKNEFSTILLIYFIQFWNDYQTPFLYLNDKPTLFYAIYSVSQNSGLANEVSNVCGQMAIAFIGMVPTTLVFVLFHKKLLGSITVGGIK